jgi:glycosyltransferase involved in cell wall biosynthesis/LmbE family N-acetylglucosaminyl deacetylase
LKIAWNDTLLETDLTPYTATKTLPGSSALVLAPHADDEVFGCTGAILRHLEAGARVHVVILTDGSEGGESHERQAESQAAAGVLGYGVPIFWDIPDRALRYSEELVQRLMAQIESVEADILYAPSPWEVHPDHRQAMAIAVEAARRTLRPIQLAFYEVGGALQPNFLLDISDLMEVKDAAMQCFPSQLKNQDYARHIRALNAYRTYTLPATVTAAEAYRVIAPNELHGVLTAGFQLLPQTQFASWRSGSVTAPLVSVMLRSMDIDLLAEALDSISLQNYPNIEVIVVSAQPTHRPLPAKCGPFPLRLVGTGTRLPRSIAANLALQNARGEFLLFLDDDDWLMPGHIARLVEVLAKHPHSPAAYTGISLVDAKGTPTGQDFDLPYDAVRQMAGNMTPIHAVLFRAASKDLGVKFDEQLDRLEDWDFWLQMSRLGPIVHLPGVSAVYRIHQSSGVHTDAGPMGAASARIYQKWSSEWTPEQVGGMMQRVWSYTELQAQHAGVMASQAGIEEELQRKDQLLTAQQLRIDALNATIDGQTESNQALQQDLVAIRSSMSWRITAPARSLIAKLKGLMSDERANTSAIATIAIEQDSQGQMAGPQSFGSQEGIAYADWVSQFDTPSVEEITRWRNTIHNWSNRTLISVVMPVYNPPINYLREAIESVRAQIYPNWELCIADDASTDKRVWPLLQHFAASDSRIKVTRREVNGHISLASNSALQLATGDFIALMDNDDLLPSHALFFVANAIQEHPDAQIIYSDEDKLNAEGERYDAYFKPDWNYTLFLGQNLISHLGAYRASLVMNAGGFREGFEGSQDYDLALRCIEKIKPSEILHIPKVLYHWRAIDGSTASGKEAKPYAVLAAKRAVEEHRSRIGMPCKVEILPIQYCRCMPPEDLSIAQISVIVIDPQDLMQSTSAAGWWSEAPFNVCDVSHSSGSMASLETAVANSSGDLICIVQSGLRPASVEDLLVLAQYARESGTGIAAGTVRNNSGLLVSGGLILNAENSASILLAGLQDWDPGYMGRGALSQELSAVSLHCVVIRKDVLNTLVNTCSTWDSSMASALAVCQQIRACNLRVIWCPHSNWHGSLQVSAPMLGAQALALDLYYHPVLDPYKGDFSISRLR